MADKDVQEIQELFDDCSTQWHDVYDDAKSDLIFYGGEQWNEDDVTSRQLTKRPTLTINRLPQFVHQVTNDIRMNVPQIKVLPMDDNATIHTAKVYQGLIKNIEYISGAPAVYDTAAENSVKCGLGWIRVDHDYIGDSFEQHLLLRRVVNPLAVMIDYTSTEADGSDATYGFSLDTISQSAFKKLWPKEDAVSFADNRVINEGVKDPRNDAITVAEYFKLVQEPVEVVMMADGAVLEMQDAILAIQQNPNLQIVNKRTIQRNTVKRQKLSGAAILEETTFPGRYIPLIPVYGEEHWEDGKRKIFSLIRHAKDAQKMHNAWASLETELLMKAPQAPFLVEEGTTEGYERQWRNPGAEMVLTYKRTGVDGQPATPPQRLEPPPVPAGIVNARMATVEDMMATMGIYKQSIGDSPASQSGIAIQRQQKEGDVATAHFNDNLNRSICHAGRILISAIPTVIDTPRMIRILGEEDEPSMVGVNGQISPDQEHMHDLSVGKYDCAVIAGPSFTTRRQEMQNTMQQLVQAVPQLMGVIGDLLFKYSDMPGADVIAERLKRTIPPQLTQDENGQKQDPQVMQMQQMMQQAQQHISQLSQALQQCEAELKNKQGEQQIKAKEVDLKAVELEIKKAEVAIEAYQAQMATQQKNTGAVEGKELDLGTIPQMKTPEQMHNEQLQASQAQMQNGNQQAMAVLQALNAIKQSFDRMTFEIQKPKAVLRNEHGAIVGVS